ncbi:hypothetical protein V5F53_00600 [Xanthobacter sp. V4C-4]|uniref:hypothetical protein n=1 Tax=Xanthobacter cornucopiae TaxID=3119924 RepID=UPI003726E387
MAAMRVFRAAGGTTLAGMGLGLCLGLGSAVADPLPLPTADFSLKASLPRGATMDLSHSQGRMRVEVSKPEVPGSVVGIIDLKARRMVMLAPNLPKMAVEIELPPEYVAGALTGTGTKGGSSQVAGEPCDIWQVDPPLDRKIGPTQACITPDGIALRTEADIQGTRRILYEVTNLTRGPQDPRQFELPPGVKVMKVPQGKLGGMLGLPGAAKP